MNNTLLCLDYGVVAAAAPLISVIVAMAIGFGIRGYVDARRG